MEPIDDYALIGDGRGAALVSRRGSIDWLCWPRFDSPPLFARLLDPDGGCWWLGPTAPSRVSRRYVEATNVLETVFDTDDGTLVLTDLMPVASEEDKRRLLLPEHELVRAIECTRGEVEVETILDPRPDYGQAPVRPRLSPLGVRMSTPAGLLVLRADLPLQADDDGRVRARVQLRAGDRRYGSLTLAAQSPAILPPIGEWTRAAVDRSVRWWRQWAGRLAYTGPARDAVMRSALALKLLVYAPSGAIVAAPTTSLPERIGGDLNWDYRFCWLRDAVAHRPRAVRPGLPRRGGGVRQLAAPRHATDPARAAVALRRLRQAAATRADARPPARLPGLAPGAGRQRRARPAPARRLRRGHRRREPLLPRGRTARPRDPADASRTSASSSAATGGSRTTASGSRAARARPQHALAGPVLDRARPAARACTRAATCRGLPAEAFESHRERDPPRGRARGLEPGARAATSPSWTATRSTPACCCSPGTASRPASSPRMRATLRASASGSAPAGRSCTATSRERRPARARSASAASGRPSTWRCGGGHRGRGARLLRARCSATRNDLGLFAEEIDPATGDAPRQLPAGVHARRADQRRPVA